MGISEFQPDDAGECQQPGDIEDHVSMLVNAVRNESRKAASEAQSLLLAEIEREQQRAYAEGRKDESDDHKALRDAVEQIINAGPYEHRRPRPTSGGMGEHMIEFDRLPRATIFRIREQCRDKGLDEIGTAWAIEAEAERAIVAQLAALLPGTYYMDPPDGGSVTVLEQLQRMAKDAEIGRRHREHAAAAIACELRCEG